MEETILNANIRNTRTKGELNEIKRKGMIPAIVYGKKKKSVSVMVNEKDFTSTIHTHYGINVVINLNIEGEKKGRNVIVKEIQQDPIKDNFLHIDFHEISLKEKVEVEVPLEVVGVAPGVKEEGGVLEHIVRDIKIKCLPTNIPDKIDADISQLKIGDVLTIGDLNIPKDVEVLNEKEKIVVNVIPPTVLEEPKPEEEAVLEGEKKPEIIAKGKKEEETEEEKPKEKREEGKE